MGIPRASVIGNVGFTGDRTEAGPRGMTSEPGEDWVEVADIFDGDPGVDALEL